MEKVAEVGQCASVPRGREAPPASGSQAPAAGAQPLTRREPFDADIRRPLACGTPEREQLRPRRLVEARTHAACEESLWLAREIQPTFALGEEERLLAHTVPSREELTLRGVPDGEGEHSVESVEHRGAVECIELEENLRVGRCSKPDACTLQLSPQIRAVVDLTVVNDAKAAVGRRHGHYPVLVQIDDRQATRGETHSRSIEFAIAVRPAVEDAIAHTAREPCLWITSGEGDHPRDAAHARRLSAQRGSGSSNRLG